MSKSTRSIKDSIGGAAFDFVKQGFEEPKKTPAASQPKIEEPASIEPEKKLAVVSREEKPKTEKPKPATTPRKKTAAIADENSHRVPVSTRMKAGLVAEIKREGLRRQLAGDSVCTMQGILEQAAEEWLKRNSTA